MVNSVKKALSPVFLITFFLGLGILRYPLSQSRYYLNIFYMLTVWSVYAYTLYYTIILFSKNIFDSVLVIFIVVLNLFVAMISIIINMYEHEKFRQCIEKLGHVDDTLEKLSTSKEYRRMQNLIKQRLIITLLIICMSWLIDSLLCIVVHNDTRAILIPYVLNYSVYVNTITDITFMLLLRCIGSRLDKINTHIEQLSKTEDYGLRCKWKKSLVSNYKIRDSENHKRVLWTVIHLHSELCRIARNINSFFGIQMTLQMISYFIILIGIFYLQYHTIFEILFSKKISYITLLNVLLSYNIWFIIFLIKFILLNHVCESVSTKAQKTKVVIHKLTNLICFAEVRKEIYQFVLQISLRPLKFSGLGLFYFGYDFIRKFFVWFVTSVIFLTQMDIIPIWNEIHNRNNATRYN